MLSSPILTSSCITCKPGGRTARMTNGPLCTSVSIYWSSTTSATLNQYDVINKRHERRSILLTSNRDPAEWATCLVDPLIAFAGLDRLSNQVHVLIITGASAEPRDIFGLVGGGLGGHPRPPPTTTFQPSCLWLH
jgi:hypothetical protein